MHWRVSQGDQDPEVSTCQRKVSCRCDLHLPLVYCIIAGFGGSFHQENGYILSWSMDFSWSSIFATVRHISCNCETCFLQFCSATGYSLSMVCLIICSVHSYRNLYMITPYTMTLTDMHIEQIVVKSSPQLSCANSIYTRNDNNFSSTVFLDVCSPTSIISVLGTLYILILSARVCLVKNMLPKSKKSRQPDRFKREDECQL